MSVRLLLALLFAATFARSSLHGQAAPMSALARQVFAAESSFAASLANRDTAAFAALVSPEAVFFGDKSVMRGKQAVVESWSGLFQGPTAPFSWKPETVEVLPSGSLALSTGPVFNPKGKQTGNFTSIWRREPDGRWLVIYDKGCPVCAECKPGQ